VITSAPRIRPLQPRSLRSIKKNQYDAALASLGFERRCRQTPKAIGTPAIAAAIAFGDRREHDYAANERWFAQNGWEHVEIPEEEVIAWVGNWMSELAGRRDDPVRVAVDVSSMSRMRIAAVIEALLHLGPEARAEVDLLYTPAEFEPPPKEDPPVFSVAPVSSYFAGWWTDLGMPLVAVIGVGYELEMAASAIDKLEPERTIVFTPDGEDPRYAREVERANRALMATKGVDRPPTPYEVANPFGCFTALESQLSRLETQSRVALVPLGPKIYAACAMLAAGLHLEQTQVIRVSAGDRQQALNRKSNGKLCGLRVVVGPADTEGDLAHRVDESQILAPGDAKRLS
jgi:predicted transcriptional regulator